MSRGYADRKIDETFLFHPRDRGEYALISRRLTLAKTSSLSYRLHVARSRDV